MGATIIDTLASRQANRHPMLDAPSGCGGSCSTPPAGAARLALDSPPVRVNGVAIPETEIAREVQHHEGANIEEARASAARALVIRHLLLARAMEAGIAPSPEQDVLGRWESDEEAMIREIIRIEAEPAEPTDEECRRVLASGRLALPENAEAAMSLVRDRLKARAWLAASARYVAQLVRSARIEGLNLLEGGQP
jgi:peptidyl-prolyl cis-trans isomerase C